MADLEITALAPGRHTATCGEIYIPEQPTEIDLIREMGKKGLRLEDFSHSHTYGTDYPFIWVWTRK